MSDLQNEIVDAEVVEEIVPAQEENEQVISEEELAKLFGQQQDPEAQIRAVLEGFDDEKLAALTDALSGYEAFVAEYEVKVNEALQSGDDVDESIFPAGDDERQARFYQEVAPVYGILHHNGKIPEDYHTRLTKTSAKLQRAVNLATSLLPVDVNQIEAHAHQLEDGVVRGCLGMFQLQMVNCLRTLKGSRKGGTLSSVIISEVVALANNAYIQTRNYLEFIDVPKEALDLFETNYLDTVASLEQYNQFVTEE